MNSRPDAPSPGKALPAWKTLQRRPWLDTGPFLKVEAHDIQLPDGREIKDWPWVITPEYAVIAARDRQGRWLFFRQTKYAARGELLAPPGGFLEPGEDPMRAAHRELLEETGYTASEWKALGAYVIDANRGAGTAHLFMALDAEPATGSESGGHDDLEEQELVLLSEDELRRALREGRFKVLAWAALVSLVLLRFHCHVPGESGSMRGRHRE